MPARAHSNNNKKDEKTPLDSPGKESWARRCRATMPSKLCVARTQYKTHPWPSPSNLTQPAGAKKKTERKTAGAEWKPIEIEAGVDISALWGMLKNRNRVGRMQQ